MNQSAEARLVVVVCSALGGTPTQNSALATIHRNGPISLGALADHEAVAPPTITRVVDRLETMGLVERRPDASDRRSTQVAITAAGTKLLATIRVRKNVWLATRLDALNDTDVRMLPDLVDVLEKLIANENG